MLGRYIIAASALLMIWGAASPAAVQGETADRVVLLHGLGRSYLSMLILAHRLEKAGFRVWLDYRSLIPGTPWKEQIDAGLEDSDTVLLVVSKASMASKYVELEWRHFLDMEKRLILLIFEAVDLPKELEVFDRDILKGIAQYTQYIAGGIFFVILFILYLKYYKNTSGIVKKRVLLSMIGIWLFLLGILLDSDLFSLLFPNFILLFSILAPTLSIIGTILYFYSHKA